MQGPAPVGAPEPSPGAASRLCTRAKAARCSLYHRPHKRARGVRPLPQQSPEKAAPFLVCLAHQILAYFPRRPLCQGASPPSRGSQGSALIPNFEWGQGSCLSGSFNGRHPQIKEKKGTNHIVKDIIDFSCTINSFPSCLTSCYSPWEAGWDARVPAAGTLCKDPLAFCGTPHLRISKTLQMLAKEASQQPL